MLIGLDGEEATGPQVQHQEMQDGGDGAFEAEVGFDEGDLPDQFQAFNLQSQKADHLIREKMNLDLHQFRRGGAMKLDLFNLR